MVKPSDGMCVQFDTANLVLCDEQRIMLSKANVEWLLARCLEHLEHSDLELVALGRLIVQEHNPKMEAQFNFEGYYP